MIEMTEENKVREKWIKFELADKQNPKTQVYNVVAKEDGFILSQVKWFGRWRKYAFFPNEDTVYEKCLL